MRNNITTRYNLLTNSLNEMRQEYKITPSKFLLKNIELVDSKLKKIDSLIGRSSSGGGNYQSVLNENTNFSL